MILARPVKIACVSAFLALGVWGLHQSHQLGRAEMQREAAISKGNAWQAEAEKFQLELAQIRSMLSTCTNAVDSIRKESATRALAVKEARDQANGMALELNAAVSRLRASQGSSCAEAMPMVREALGL